MWYELSWNDDNEAHIARHGVTPSEVHEVLDSEPRRVEAGRDETTLVFGATYSGRYLLVVLAAGDDGRAFVVTARDLTAKEKSHFRRRMNQ